MYAGTDASREIPRTVQGLSSESLTGQVTAVLGLQLCRLMRTSTSTVGLTLLLLAISASPALAQRRAPAKGMVGLGASVGVDIPTDAALDKGIDIAANIEGYLTSRVSVRGQLGGSWWDIVGQRFSGTIKPLYLDGNVVYNWEGGAVHPY